MLRRIATFRAAAPRLSPSARVRAGIARALVPCVVAAGLLGASGCLKVPGGSSANPQAQVPKTPPKNVKALIDRYVLSMGGQEALAKLEQRTTESEIVFLKQEGCEAGRKDCLAEDISGQLVMYNSADEKMFQRTVVRNQVEERGFDGKESWSVRGEPSLLYLEPASAVPAAREDAMLHWYFDYAKRGVEPKLLKSRQVGEDKHWLDGLVWRAKGEPEAGGRELWFDRQTGLLAEEIERGEVTGPDQQPVETTQTLYFEKYQPVDGVQVPHLIRQVTRAPGSPDSTVEIRVLSVRHGKNDPKRYQIPTLPKPAPVADPVLAALTAAQSSAKAQAKELTAQMELARKSYLAARFDEAKAAATAALGIDAKDPEAHYILGQIAALQGDAKTLSSRMAKSKKYGAAEQPLSYMLAWADVENRNYASAVKHFKGAQLEDLAERFGSLGKPKVSGKCRADFVLQPSAVPVISVPGKDGELKLMVDTSASELVLSTKAATSLLVMPQGQAPVTAGGPKAPYGTLENFDLGGIKLSSVPVTILPDGALTSMAGGDASIQGIIGGRLLLDFVMAIHPQKQTLSLVAQRSSCKKDQKALRKGNELPVVVHEGRFVFIPGAIGTHEGMYLLNTGMRGAVMMGNTRAFAIAGIAPDKIRMGEVPIVTLPSFSLRGKTPHEISGIPAAYGLLQDQWTGAGFRLDGMVGGWVFGARPWALDMKGRRIWVGPKPAAPAKSK